MKYKIFAKILLIIINVAVAVSFILLAEMIFGDMSLLLKCVAGVCGLFIFQGIARILGIRISIIQYK